MQTALRSHVPRVFNSEHGTVLFSNADSNFELTITFPGFMIDCMIEEFSNRLETIDTVRPGAGVFPTVSSVMPWSVDLRTSRAAFPPSDNGAIRHSRLPTAVTVAFLSRMVQQEAQSAVRNGPCTVNPAGREASGGEATAHLAHRDVDARVRKLEGALFNGQSLSNTGRNLRSEPALRMKQPSESAQSPPSHL